MSALAEVHLQGWTDRVRVTPAAGVGCTGRGGVHWQEGCTGRGGGALAGVETHHWQGWGHWPRREALAEEHWQKSIGRRALVKGLEHHSLG